MKPYQIKTIGGTSNGHVDGLHMWLDGCPADGLAAIDWRRANGLPSEPTGRIVLSIDHISETLARKYAARLDSHAALTITDLSNVTAQITIPYGSPVPAEIARAILTADAATMDDAAAALIDHALSIIAAARAKTLAEQIADPAGQICLWQGGCRQHVSMDRAADAVARGATIHTATGTLPESMPAVQAVMDAIHAAAAEIRTAAAAAAAARELRLRSYLDSEQTAMQDRGLLDLPAALNKIESRLDREAAETIASEIAPPQTTAEIIGSGPIPLATTATRSQWRTLRAVERRLGRTCQLLPDGRILATTTTADGREIRIALTLATA